MKLAPFAVIAVLANCLSLCFAGPAAGGVGDRLLRTFLIFKNMPLTVNDAYNKGWDVYYYEGTHCAHDLGVVMTEDGNAPGKLDPTFLLFNYPAGQLSGFGVRAWGITPGPDLSPAFWKPVEGEDDAYDLFIIFRNNLCSTSNTSSSPLGDFASINGNFSIPLWANQATAAGWYPGNCIKRMGAHYWYDLASPGSMTWNADTMVPVLPMYLTSGPQSGYLHAILVATPQLQWMEPIGEYEGPFPNFLFCKNACAKDQSACSQFTNSGIWSTMHWEFSDPSLADCANAPCSL